MSGGRCHLSGRYCPSLDEHHVIPREYGGENGPTIMLCPDVHQTLHRSVNNVRLREEFISSLPANRQKYAHELIEKIIKSAHLHKDNATGDTVRTLHVTLPASVIAKLATKAKDSGLSSANKLAANILTRLVK